MSEENQVNQPKNDAVVEQAKETKTDEVKTENTFTKKSFIYDFLSSMRQKINDPLGKRKKPN